MGIWLETFITFMELVKVQKQKLTFFIRMDTVLFYVGPSKDDISVVQRFPYSCHLGFYLNE